MWVYPVHVWCSDQIWRPKSGGGPPHSAGGFGSEGLTRRVELWTVDPNEDVIRDVIFGFSTGAASKLHSWAESSHQVSGLPEAMELQITRLSSRSTHLLTALAAAWKWQGNPPNFVSEHFLCTHKGPLWFYQGLRPQIRTNDPLSAGEWANSTRSKPQARSTGNFQTNGIHKRAATAKFCDTNVGHPH